MVNKELNVLNPIDCRIQRHKAKNATARTGFSSSIGIFSEQKEPHEFEQISQ